MASVVEKHYFSQCPSKLVKILQHPNKITEQNTLFVDDENISLLHYAIAGRKIDAIKAILKLNAKVTFLIDNILCEIHYYVTANILG